MFGKRSSNQTSNTTIVGRGAHFTGTLEVEGDVHVEGQFDGTIHAQAQLSIGPHGSVKGELSGGVVIIAGRVEGKTIAQETLHVLSSGSLQGDIFYGRLQVDSGGVIDGRTHQGAPTPMLTASATLETAHEPETEPREESRVIDARPKLNSASPPPVEVARSSAPGRR